MGYSKTSGRMYLGSSDKLVVSTLDGIRLDLDSVLPAVVAPVSVPGERDSLLDSIPWTGDLSKYEGMWFFFLLEHIISILY